MGPLIFHVHATYIISGLKHKRFLSFSAAKRYGRTDRQTDGRTDGRTEGQAQTNILPQLLRSWGHKKQKNKVLEKCWRKAIVY